MISFSMETLFAASAPIKTANPVRLSASSQGFSEGRLIPFAKRKVSSIVPGTGEMVCPDASLLMGPTAPTSLPA